MLALGKLEGGDGMAVDDGKCLLFTLYAGMCRGIPLLMVGAHC